VPPPEKVGESFIELKKPFQIIIFTNKIDSLKKDHMYNYKVLVGEFVI